MKACRNRSLSLLLLLCIVMCTLSFSVFANPEPEKAQSAGTDYAAGAAIDQDVVTTEMKEKAGQGIVEIESLREESSKHFQLEDGSYQSIAYGAAVHTMDGDGKWRDIDNRLYADRTESGRYSTRDGRFSFAESVSADELYIIDDGQYRISFGALLEGSPRSTAVIENHADRKTAAEGLTGEEKLEALKTIDNATRIKYYSVNDGVDLEYIISGNDVKENIIISQPTTKSVFTYRLKLIGLSAELEDNTISLKNKDGETVYLLTAPYMYDSAGAESAKVSYALEKDNEVCVITIDADSDWINDPERVFPVTVDPSVTKKILLDTYINSAYPTTSYGSQTSVVIGSTKIAYMFALMPNIPTYADINYATLSLHYYFASSSGGADIGLYRCLHTWSESMTWNDTNSWSNRGLSTTRTAIATATASSNINQNNPGTVSLNVTPLVQQWYAGGKNYGFGLKYEGGSLTNVYVHTYESTSSFRAYFTISYETATDLTIENGTYFIKNKHTERYADTCQHTYEGGYIEQYDFTADITQRWTFKYAHFGYYYTIKSEDSTTEYYMGVLGDSTSADVNVVMRQGLDSNGTRTMSDGMLWSVSNTASGAYKIQAITGEASDLALCVGAYVFNSNGVDIEQRYYGNDSDYKDEWYLIRPEAPECSIFLSEKVVTRTFSIQCVGTLATGTTWYPLIQASANSWNSSGAGTNITVNTTGSSYTCAVGYYGYDWFGLTAYHDDDEGTITDATIYINANTCLYDNPRKSTITHEIGHLLGLADNPPISNDQSLMNHGRNRETVYTPQTFDVVNVVYIYSLG